METKQETNTFPPPKLASLLEKMKFQVNLKKGGTGNEGWVLAKVRFLCPPVPPNDFQLYDCPKLTASKPKPLRQSTCQPYVQT